MKKINTLIMLALVALTFTACNDRWFDTYEDRNDRKEASVLEGTWTGFIDTYIYDRFGLRGDSYRTTMYFERQDSYGGWGYEVDYNLNSPQKDYYYCEFTWEVYGGDILINYADSWNTVAIYDYGLNNNRFWGYMDDGTSKDIAFELFYDGRFDWSFYRSYYAPTRSGETPRYHASGEFAKKTEEASN